MAYCIDSLATRHAIHNIDFDVLHNHLYVASGGNMNIYECENWSKKHFWKFDNNGIQSFVCEQYPMKS